MAGEGFSRLSPDITYNDEETTCRGCLSSRNVSTEVSASFVAARADGARSAPLAPCCVRSRPPRSPGWEMAGKRLRRLAFPRSTPLRRGGGIGRRITRYLSAPAFAARTPRSRFRTGGRSTGGRPSVSGTSWVLPAPFDTHDVPLVVTVVVMVAIGGRGGATARRDSGGKWWGGGGSAAPAAFALHPSAHMVTERVCRARGCRARGGERAEAADGGGGDRARAVERVGVEGRARPWKGPAGRWVGTVAGCRVAGCGCGGYRCPRQGMSCGTT